MAEETKGDKAVEKPAEPAKSEEAAPKQDPEKKVEAAQAAPAAPAKAGTKQAKIEKPANCVVCNKSIKKKRWYYRNGKFYCTKRCWKTTIKKEEEKPQEAQESGKA